MARGRNHLCLTLTRLLTTRSLKKTAAETALLGGPGHAEVFRWWRWVRPSGRTSPFEAYQSSSILRTVVIVFFYSIFQSNCRPRHACCRQVLSAFGGDP